MKPLSPDDRTPSSRTDRGQRCRTDADLALCSDDDWVRNTVRKSRAAARNKAPHVVCSPKASKCPSGCRLHGLVSQMEAEVDTTLWKLCEAATKYEGAAEKCTTAATHIHESSRRTTLARNRKSQTKAELTAKPESFQPSFISSGGSEAGGAGGRFVQEPHVAKEPGVKPGTEDEGAANRRGETAGRLAAVRGDVFESSTSQEGVKPFTCSSKPWFRRVRANGFLSVSCVTEPARVSRSTLTLSCEPVVDLAGRRCPLQSTTPLIRSFSPTWT